MGGLRRQRGGAVSNRLAAPGPDVAWTTVCFRGARGGGVLPGDDPDGPSLVVWRSTMAHGPALVRSDRLLPSAERHVDPYPSPCRHAPGPLPCDVHLWVDAGSGEAGSVDAGSPERAELMNHADVLVTRVLSPPGSACRRVHELLAGHPGCLAAAVPGTDTTCVVGVRGRTGAVSSVRLNRGGSGTRIPPHTVASVVHAWVVSGRPLRALRSVALMPSMTWVPTPT